MNDSARRQGARILLRRARVIGALVWEAAPGVTLMLAGLTAAAGVAPAATAWLNRSVIDAIVPAGRSGVRPPAGHVVALAVALGLTGLASAVLPYGRQFGEGEMRRRLGLLVQDRMFQAINALPGLSRFESPRFYDKIRMVRQISGSVPARLVSAVMISGQSLITLVAMLGALYVINPVLAGVTGMMAGPAIVAQLANSRRRADLEWQSSPAARREVFYSRLLGDRDAAKEVRLFGLGDFLRGRMLAEIRAINAGQRALDVRIFTVEGVLSAVTAAITAGGMIWAVRAAVAGRLSVGDVTMFAIAVVGVQGAVGNLVSRAADLYQSLLLFGHYVDVVAGDPDLPLASDPLELPALRAGIELRDVWFRYDDEHDWVLRGVSMAIPHGASVALVGLNGAGKSTLVKLLCRLYDPVRGSITWDGIDLRDVSPAALRARIGTLFQDYMCYDMTAAENIGVGDLAMLGDAGRVRLAAARAGVHDKLASLPRGYATMLSRIFFADEDAAQAQAGVVLSGGQWQRLALARALMRADRDLLILDEPSSGLDAGAEHAVHQQLCEVRAGRTSLLISHRLGAVRDAVSIVVISAGQVAEQGTHEQLMAARGEYFRLFTLQASGYRANEPVS